MAGTSPAMTVNANRVSCSERSDPRDKLGGRRAISIAVHDGMDIARMPPGSALGSLRSSPGQQWPCTVNPTHKAEHRGPLYALTHSQFQLRREVTSREVSRGHL